MQILSCRLCPEKHACLSGHLAEAICGGQYIQVPQEFRFSKCCGIRRFYNLLQVLQGHQLIDMIAQLDRCRQEQIRCSLGDHLAAKFSLYCRAEFPAGKFFAADAVLKIFCEHFDVLKLQFAQSPDDALLIALVGKCNPAGRRIELNTGNTFEIAEGILQYLRLRCAVAASRR